MLNGLALFAGIGGIETGLRKWIRTVCYVEKEPYAIAAIRSRIGERSIDDAPIWDDVQTFSGKPWNGTVDIITGGFPCQDISTAGRKRGINKDTRSGLWFQMLRIINEVRPSFVFVENVSAISKRGLDIVLGQLSEAGYDARWTNLRASDVGARHRRERIFILAHTDSRGLNWTKVSEKYTRTSESNITRSGFVADARSDAFRNIENEAINREDKRIRSCRKGRESQWHQDPAELDPSSESFVGRVADGVPNRVDRIKCLGNAVVPGQAERAWEILTNMEGHR